MSDKLNEKMNKQYEEVKTKVKKLGKVKLTILIIMTVATVCSYVFSDFFFASDSIFNRGATESTFLNDLLALVPKIVRAFRIVTIGLICETVIVTIVRRIFRKNPREITVATLINSIVKWVTVVVLVIAVLAAFGVDTTALITGAGVITLVVGLGMQSLIADVVAGLFIVFENVFNVGDIITVDDFRGVVTSIGIRTTKIELCGNIKIINNSEIVSVLNQSVKPSYVKVLVEVGYGESLARVEEVIDAKLKGASVENTVEPLNYDGVAELGKSSVTLQFSTYCNEADYYAAQRSMNKYIKTVFDENGIEIPYGQVIVHEKSE